MVETVELVETETEKYEDNNIPIRDDNNISVRLELLTIGTLLISTGATLLIQNQTIWNVSIIAIGVVMFWIRDQFKCPIENTTCKQKSC